MPIPIAVYAGVTLAGAVYYKVKYPDGIVTEISEDAARKLIDEGVPILEDVAGALGTISLAFVEGLGSAVVKGVDNAYDSIRDKFIKGKEPDIIAGFTIALLTILTGVYVWHSVKNARDAL
jgi:nitrogenase molybdenum-iron protein alpha/beta subunit